MSSRSRRFKKDKRHFQQRLDWNNGPDRVYGDWQLIEVNGIEMLPGYLWEFDFWCSNGKGVYILRICHAKKRHFYALKARGRHRITYLYAVCEFEEVNDELIQSVLNTFDEYGIPKWRNGFIYAPLKIG